MKLRYSLGSPFARKTAMAAHVLGLADKIEMIDHSADPSNTMRHQNPLHKIPMLIADDGEVIFDSPVIVEYLDELAGGGKIIPAKGLPRYRTLTRLALADGIAEATVLIYYEDRWRDPGQKSERWINHQAQKIERALEVFENDLPQSFDAAAMGLYCALHFLDRNPVYFWRERFPKLADWMAQTAASEPVVQKTEPA